MLPHITEFLGTMILIILGDGAVTDMTLNKSGMKGAGSIQITFTWGLAVMLPTLVFGAASGTHFSPAPIIVLTVGGSMSWGLVPGYTVAQFAGVFMGTVTVYLLFKDQYDATESTATKLGTFYTGPSVPNMGRNILNEVVGTLVLIFTIKNVSQVSDTAPDVDKLFISGIIVSIGMSLGGLTGHAIDPAHDLGPRLAHVVLPIRGKGDSSRGYAPVAVIGPVMSAVVTALLYQAIPWI